MLKDNNLYFVNPIGEITEYLLTERVLDRGESSGFTPLIMLLFEARCGSY